jgi:hypothetical protein
MTIQTAATNNTFDAQLEEDEFHMLWLISRSPRNSGRVQSLLSAALQTGCRVVSASDAEQAVLDAHGFGPGVGAVKACGGVHSAQAANVQRSIQHRSDSGGESVGAPLDNFVNVIHPNVRHPQDRDQCHHN